MRESKTASAPGNETSAANNCFHGERSVKDNGKDQLKGIFIQPGLIAGDVSDPLEHKSDELADKVMRIPESNFIQRKCSHCEEEETINRKPLTSFVQRKESARNVAGNDAISNQINSTKGNGSVMDSDTKGFMENRFGADFSAAKIHTGNEAAQMSRDIEAKAFTTGIDIYFNEGQYQPGSSEGKHLLAHELTHTIQQNQVNPLNSFVQLKKGATDPLSKQTATLNNSKIKYTSRVYQKAANDWPGDKPIWDILKTPEAKEKFIRFILSIDQTNCVIYDDYHPNFSYENCSATAEAAARFKNGCQGYAAQMYTRYTLTGRMSAEATSNLQTDANVIVGNVPPKFQIPIKIVTRPGHAFNSVLIGDDPHDVGAWLFFDPQTDRIFYGSDAEFKSEVKLGIFTIGRFSDYRFTGYIYQFVDEPQEDITFILDKKGSTFQYNKVDPPQRIALGNVFRDIFIADDQDAYPPATTKHDPVQTYEQYVVNDLQKTSSADLALAFSYLDGKSFRRKPQGPTEILNRRIFLQLLNRPGLEKLIPEPQIPK